MKKGGEGGRKKWKEGGGTIQYCPELSPPHNSGRFDGESVQKLVTHNTVDLEKVS